MAHKIFIAGAGGIGSAAGLILSQYNKADYHVVLGDIYKIALEKAANFIKEGCTNGKEAETFLMSKDGDDGKLEALLQSCDVILDCLPGAQAPRMAHLAKKTTCHYANLTEYVAETNQIMEIAKGADTAFVLQTGLAPGFINVLAVKLFEDFTHAFKVDQVDSISMKVGALSQHAPAPHFYAFTWSPIGVATEYLKDAVVVKNQKTVAVPALSGVQTHIINGETYEDNYTSGGAADLPSAFAGKVKDLDYKTLRYPGHYAWVENQLSQMQEGDDQIKQLERTMLDQIPMVEDDVVIVYASVQGKDADGKLRKVEKSYKVLPSKVGNQTLRAIQSTTAAPLCEMAHLMLQKDLKGLILQSQVETDTFLNGDFVKAVYGGF
jgi:saccharopine dehydrogenase-like NADP-dependent oxidoreductase